MRLLPGGFAQANGSPGVKKGIWLLLPYKSLLTTAATPYRFNQA